MARTSLKIVLAAKVLAAALFALAGSAQAQTVAPPAAKPDSKPEMMQSCPGLVAARPPLISRRLPARRPASRPVTHHLCRHSTFLIESPQLVRIATDYNDYVRPPVVPDIVTMNHAHTSHYTDNPDPAIKQVLRGWADNEKPARIDTTYRDVRVRNVPTNIRTWGGATESTAIRSSSSRWPISASPISAICITR